MASSVLREVVAAVFATLIATTAIAETRPAGALPDFRVAQGNKNIAQAWLADPTTRYKHFVPGSPYEAASLVVRLEDDDVSTTVERVGYCGKELIDGWL